MMMGDRRPPSSIPRHSGANGGGLVEMTGSSDAIAGLVFLGLIYIYIALVFFIYI